MITCQHCQTQTEDGSIFCYACGHELAPAATPQAQRSNVTPKPVNLGPAPAYTIAPPPTVAPAPLNGPVAIELRLADGRRLTLSGKNEFTIGRMSANHPEPDIDLSAYYGFEAGVSREHVKVRMSADGVFVQDLESTNETVHNGYRLLPQQWYPLRDGDELRLGALVLYVTLRRR